MTDSQDFPAELPADPVAHVDRRWLGRALLALLHNAAVHSRPGAAIQLNLMRVPQGWRFEVADEGGGVPAGHEEAIFEPFYRVSHGDDGSGLGLALVRGVAEAHGGGAGVANRPGHGATFWMRVPA